MSSIQQYSQRRAPTFAIPQRQPACTHTTMTRLYGKHKCWICHEIPQIGWLYHCEADSQLIPSLSKDESHLLTLKSENKRSAPKIIKGSHSGMVEKNIHNLTIDQVDRIKAQRQHVKEVILTQQATSDEDISIRHVSADRKFIQSGEKKGVNGKISGGSASKTKISDTPLEPCQFNACHRCRPSYLDRTWLRFEDIFEGKIQRTFESESCRRVSDVRLVRNLGIRSGTHPLTGSTTWTTKKHTATVEEENSPSFGELRLAHDISGISTDLAMQAKSMRQTLNGIVLTRRKSAIPLSPSATHIPKSRLRRIPSDNDLRSSHDSISGSLTPQTDMVVITPSLVVHQEHRWTAMNGIDGEGSAESKHFDREPLQLDEGIAVTEESLVNFDADLVTQV